MNSTERFPLDPEQYQLLDFGGNEKLEMLGGIIISRETPSVTGSKDPQTDWGRAQLKHRSGWKESCGKGGVGLEGGANDDWHLEFGASRFALRPTPTGQVGIFPEQAVNWNWIDQLPIELTGAKALNLFAYTGGTTLALAHRGAEVVHCDSAKSVVNWARANAAASGLQQAPIRWMVEDALTFVRREIKRGNKYQIVVADPPSFGRGPGGESWKMKRDFQTLVDGLSELTGDGAQMILISCHTPDFDHTDLGSAVSRSFHLAPNQGESFELSISAANGKTLPSGQCFRWFNKD